MNINNTHLTSRKSISIIPKTSLCFSAHCFSFVLIHIFSFLLKCFHFSVRKYVYFLEPFTVFITYFPSSHAVHLIISWVITSVHKLSLGVFQQNMLSAFKCRCQNENSLISPSTYRNVSTLQYGTKRTKAEDMFVSIPRLGFKAMAQPENTKKDLKMSQSCRATTCGVKFSRQNH